MTRREVALTASFPAEFGSYVEDVWWCFACWDRGYRCAVVADRTMTSHGSISPNAHRMIVRNTVQIATLRRGRLAGWSMRALFVLEGMKDFVLSVFVRPAGRARRRTLGCQRIAGVWDSISMTRSIQTNRREVQDE